MPAQSITQVPAGIHIAGWVIVAASGHDDSEGTTLASSVHTALIWAGVDASALHMVSAGEVLWLLPSADPEAMMQAEIAVDRVRLGLRATNIAGHVHAGFYRAHAGDQYDECLGRARAATGRAGADLASRIVTYHPELHETPTRDSTADTGHVLTWPARLAGAIAAEMGWPNRRRRALARATAIDDLSIIDPEVTMRPETPMLLGVFSSEQLAWLMHQHEHWDGTGQPMSLRGSQISEGGLIIAVARRYARDTNGWPNADSQDETFAECERLSGLALSPHVVAALERVLMRRRGARGATGVATPTRKVSTM